MEKDGEKGIDDVVEVVANCVRSDCAVVQVLW